MKSPVRSLEQIQRDLVDFTIEITRTQFASFTVPGGWRPALNAFRCDGHLVICVELAGVDKTAIEVHAEPRRLTIRGVRAVPEPACGEPPALQVFAMEIDHGRFERVLDLPVEVEPERVAAEHRNGLLWIKLPFRTHG